MVIPVSRFHMVIRKSISAILVHFKGIWLGGIKENGYLVLAASDYGIEAHITDYEDDGVVSNREPSIFSRPGAGNIFFLIQNGMLLPDAPQGLALFFDRDSDGIYGPSQGDYPMPENAGIIPVQIIWCVYNDEGGGQLDNLPNVFGVAFPDGSR